MAGVLLVHAENGGLELPHCDPVPSRWVQLMAGRFRSAGETRAP